MVVVPARALVVEVRLGQRGVKSRLRGVRWFLLSFPGEVSLSLALARASSAVDGTCAPTAS